MSVFSFLSKRVSLFIFIVSLCGAIAGIVWMSCSKAVVRYEPFQQLDEEYRTFFSTAVPREAKVEELVTAGFSKVLYNKENCWPAGYDRNRAEYYNKENRWPDNFGTDKNEIRFMASKYTRTSYYRSVPKDCRNLIMGRKPIAEISYEINGTQFYEVLTPIRLEWAPSELSQKRPIYGDLDYPVLERGQMIKIFVSPKNLKHFIYENDFMAEMVRGSDDYNKNYWYKKISDPHKEYRDGSLLMSAIGYIGCHVAVFFWLIFGALADRVSKRDRKNSGE